MLLHTNLGRSLSSSLEEMGKKVLPAIGLTVCEYAPSSVARLEFEALAKAVEKIVTR